MIKVINCMLLLSLLLVSSFLFVTVTGQTNETKSLDINQESTSWYNRTHSSWEFPIFQLKSSSIPSRRYNRTFKCSGILVFPNAVITSKQCIEDNEAYVIASNMKAPGSGGRKVLPYVRQHRLYPPVEYRSYQFASTEYKQRINRTTIVYKEKIPGVVILFFDTAIHSPLPPPLSESPKYYQIYSEKINRECERISLMADSRRQISTQQIPETIIPFDNFTETFKAIRQRSHINHTTEITNISFDLWIPIFATKSDTSSDSHATLGSALICRNEDNEPVLSGVLIDTSLEGLHIYGVVGDMYDWISGKSHEFDKRTERLTYSEKDVHETYYSHDLP